MTQHLLCKLCHALCAVLPALEYGSVYKLARVEVGLLAWYQHMHSPVAVSKMHTVGHADTALGPGTRSCSDSTGGVSSLCRSPGLQYQALLSTYTQRLLYMDRQD